MTVTVTSALAGPATARYSNVYGALVDLGVLSGLGAQDVTGSGDPVAPILNASEFYAPLTNSLILTRGTGDPTYSRATNAWEFDNEGKLILVPYGAARFGGARMVRNFLTYSEDISNAAWGVTGGTTKTGTNQVDFTASTSDAILQSCAVGTSSVGFTWVGSVTLSGSGSITLGIYDNGGSFPATNESITLTATPTRYIVTRTHTDSGATRVALRIKNAVASVATIYIDEAQLENVTGQADQTASEYVSVGVLSAPYHGAGVDGVKYFNTNKDGSAISASSLLGYHAEGARKNSLLYSRDLTNAAWVATNITPAKTATGIDNAANSASTLTAGAADATILQTVSPKPATAARSFSAYVTRRTGVGPVYITRDGFATQVDISGSLQVGSLADSTKRYRVKIENTTVDGPVVGFKIATSGDEIDVDVCQDEAGAFASSPIITTTAAVTRNAENLTYASGNIGNSAGTILITGKTGVPNLLGNAHLLAMSGGGGALYVNSTSARTTVTATDITNYVSKSGLSDITTVLRKQVVSYSAATMKVTGGGTAPTSGNYDGTYSGNMQVGGYDGTWNGYIKNVYVWQSALTDAQLQQVTS